MDGSGFCTSLPVETGSSVAVRARATPVEDGATVEEDIVVEEGVVSARDRGMVVVTVV